MYTIFDWAGNYVFQKNGFQGSGHLTDPMNKFETFEDAEEFLIEKLGDTYETDRGEYIIDQIEEKL